MMQHPISEADKETKIATIASKYSWPLIAKQTKEIYGEVVFKR